MSNTPYGKCKKEEMIMRDLLAIDRNILANERTFLSYIRTALTLFIGGISFIKFFDLSLIKVIGGIFIPLGMMVFLVGLWKYRKIKKEMQRIKDKE